ncbi:MAG: hypothetical protein AAGA91_19595 [Pseudomonadota bacterium]
MAFAGGFVLISVFGAFCAVLFERLSWMPLVQGVYAMTLLNYLTWVAIAMWVFHERRLSTVVWTMTLSCATFYLLFLALR